ncbi:hypothetical protein [Phenylobacterium sp.]|uniref:hypothetical protein n=1 Tax=Phenylobacterium sp. TaxID=1871053 RepID=UPI0035B25008
MPEEAESLQEQEAVTRAFGAENRNRLIDRYFAAPGGKAVSRANAWQHVYRLLLWSDPTTGLAHCYESDKSQPGKAWYGRSLAFHDWLCQAFEVEPADLAREIDWLFLRACADLANSVLHKEAQQAEVAARQRAPYRGRDFPEPGDDPEMEQIVREGLAPYFRTEPPVETWLALTRRVRQYLAVQNKRKNLVGEGFEDVLAQTIRRACDLPADEILTRSLLFEIPGFNRAKHGQKENKVDLAIIRPSMRTLVTAKWSVRADREKQFPTEYEEYCNAEAMNQKFNYVFVTNEFDPARLMRACEVLFRNNLMFDYVVHINTEGLRAAYGVQVGRDGSSSWGRVMSHIDSGRLISLERWLSML